MLSKLSTIALCLQAVPTRSLKCPGAMIQAEDGQQICVDDAEQDHPLPVEMDSSHVEDATADVDSCLAAFCQTSTVRNFLVDACSKRGYSGCGGLSYHGTSTSYDFNGKITYDNAGAKKTGMQSGTAFNEAFKNGNDNSTDKTTLTRDIKKTTSYSWSREYDFGVSASVSMEFKVGLPLVAETNVKTEFSTSFDMKRGSTTSGSSEQDWAVSQEITIEPKSCTRACIRESAGTATVPYTVTGTFLPKGDYGFMCCYLRPGGSSSCGASTGWHYNWVPGGAVSVAKQQKLTQCNNLSPSGNNAVYTGKGTFFAGMDFEVDVVTAKGPYSQCPSESACDSLERRNVTSLYV